MLGPISGRLSSMDRRRGARALGIFLLGAISGFATCRAAPPSGGSLAEHLAMESLGLGQSALGTEYLGQVADRPRHDDVLRAQKPFVHLNCFALHGLSLGRFAAHAEVHGQVLERLGNLRALMAREISAQRQRLAVHRLTFGKITCQSVNLTQDVAEFRLHIWLVFQFFREALGRPISNMPIDGIDIHPFKVSAAFQRLLFPRAVNQDSTHGLRRCRKEMASTFPLLWLTGPNQTQVSLMHQGGRLKRMARSFVGHPVRRKLAQLLINERQQLLSCL